MDADLSRSVDSLSVKVKFDGSENGQWFLQNTRPTEHNVTKTQGQSWCSK